jgi:hypothetical protein
MPVFEADIALISDTNVNANGEDHEPDNGCHLDSREPELQFAVEIDRKEVQSRNENPKYSNEDRNVQIFVPVLDDGSGGG